MLQFVLRCSLPSTVLLTVVADSCDAPWPGSLRLLRDRPSWLLRICAYTPVISVVGWEGEVGGGEEEGMSEKGGWSEGRMK